MEQIHYKRLNKGNRTYRITICRAMHEYVIHLEKLTKTNAKDEGKSVTKKIVDEWKLNTESLDNLALESINDPVMKDFLINEVLALKGQ